jgi:hypothetical protein
MKPLWMNLSLIAALSGCTWIGDADYKAELVNVDEDGDGQTISEGDCNDQMPNVFLGNLETWYDGIDGDCGGDNDFDKDGDGFVPTEHQGKMTTSHVAVAPLPGGDCNDEDLDSFPGANDDFYDGVDSDCRGNDDYDQDGDGVAYELIDANTDVGDLARGDCDDQDPTIFPGQTETWYDGVDSDCGEDDDYDQDGDGYVPTEYQGERTTGLNGTGNLPGGDCDDLNPERYEGANEIMSDVLDYDCDLCIDQDCSQNPELGGHSATINASPWLLYSTASNP